MGEIGTFFKIGLAWAGCIAGEILLAFLYPVMTGLFDLSATATAATGNASMGYIAHPVRFIGMMPILVWFILPGVALVATLVWLREDKNR